MLFIVLGGDFKFQVQGSDLKYFFLEMWRFEKQIALFEKELPLGLCSKSLIFVFAYPNTIRELGGTQLAILPI